MNNGTDWSRYENPQYADSPDGFNEPYHAPRESAIYSQGEERHQSGGTQSTGRQGTGFWRSFNSPEAKLFRRRNRHTIIAMFIALLLLLLLCTVGLLYTLLTVLFMTVAYLIGGWLDGNPLVYRLLHRFF